MKKALKKKWVEALTSGSFEQTSCTYYDQRENAYCCLGVLAAIVGETTGVGINGHVQEAEKNMHNNAVSAFIELNDAGVPFDVIAGLINEAL